MAEDHLLFLREKFMEDLKEAEEFDEIPLLPHFKAMSEVLTPCWITSSTPISMKDSLYDLKFALAECVMSAEKETDLRSQKRKIQLIAHFVKKHWFLFCTRRKLLRIQKKLLRLRCQYLVNPRLGSTIQAWARPEAFVTDPPPFDPSRIHGFDRYLQQIEDLLLKEAPDSRRFRAIGIVGMGGSGKTALAQLVFHRARVRKSFSPMLWVQSNARARPRHIVNSIVGHLASYDEYEDGGFDNSLDNRRYLIVVDNLWHGSDDEMDPISTSSFSCFCRGLPNRRGGAIIVTSRMQEEVRKMVGGDSPDLHLIEPMLDRESCLSIVLDSIPWNCVPMRDEIAETCDGLPLAAKTLAEIVSTKFAFLTNIPPVIKRFRLRFDNHGATIPSAVLKKVRARPGVHYAYIDSEYGNVIEAEGTCNPLEVATELKGSKAEIISLKQMEYN